MFGHKVRNRLVALRVGIAGFKKALCRHEGSYPLGIIGVLDYLWTKCRASILDSRYDTFFTSMIGYTEFICHKQPNCQFSIKTWGNISNE